MINNIDISKIVEEVCKQLSGSDQMIEFEASAKHIHLSAEHVEALFGGSLTIDRELSQPGQYLYEERVTLIGSKNILKDIAILGPPRSATQIELSVTDARFLGVKPELRLSGDIQGSPGILVAANGRAISLEEGVIVAKRHIHIRPEEAAALGLSDNDMVSVEVDGDRSVTFNKVIVRISESFRKRLHIDYDEANASGISTGMIGRIIV